jgi:uncharacterized membrane protein
VKHIPAVTRVKRLWGFLRSTYWFVPGIIIAGCVGLSYIMLTLDLIYPTKYIVHLSWVYTRDAQGARMLLSVISQSMITVAGVVFSITVVALSLASNQFGPRVLQTFERDTGNQMALGTFLGTFLYGILVMRRVEGSDQHQFVPSLSVAVGIFLAMISVAVLVYFIHHVILNIQAQNVIAFVADDVNGSMLVLFPEKLGEGAAPLKENLTDAEGAILKASSVPVCSGAEGYVTSVNEGKLMGAARGQDAVIRLFAVPGDFVRQDSVVARIWSHRPIPEKMKDEIRRSLSIGVRRTYEEDIGFGLQQLALIAVRSLSPAINAVGTAMDAQERLFASLVRLGNRKIPSQYRRDEDGRLRVITDPWRFDLLLDGVFGPIRHAASSNPTVIAHILKGLSEVERNIQNPDLRRCLREYIDRFAATIEHFPMEADRRHVGDLYRRLRLDAA